MEDCWDAGVRPGMAIRETDSELGLRTAGGGGLRTRQAGRVKLPRPAVLHPPARRVTGRILEPATGTGRVLVPLLEAGFAVEGLDVSPDMLAVCRQHCQDRGLDPVLREADMTTFAEPGAYQAIIVPAGSIMLLDGRDAVPRALAAFRESLSSGGRLILDVGVPELITGPAPMRYWERDPYLWTLQDMRTVYDPVANQTTSLLRYEKWRDGGLIDTELQRFRLQYWSLTEFERLLADAGFTDISVTADYRDDHRPRPDSEVWTFHAIRPR